MQEDMVPIMLFVVIGLSVIAMAYFRFSARREQQVTIRELLTSSQNVSPEIIAELKEGLVPPPGADLRRGVISITLGVAIVLFALLLGQEDAVRPLVAISTFPFLVGVAYVVLWWVKRKDR